jgi:hypothetical protein
VNSSKQSLEIYPNPADQTIHVRFLGNQPGSGLLELVDMHGRTLIRNEVSREYEMIPLDISLLPSGFYMVKYSHISGVVSQKVVINH